MTTRKSALDASRLDRILAEDRQARAAREKGYREQALKLYPWVCGRCGREFTHSTLKLLEVHHRDSDHHNNPPDGSNWELLCTYCHEAEHRKLLDGAGRSEDAGGGKATKATHRPFEDLSALLNRKDRKS